jgi:aryl-alcohol dehydrogenase-like predicted oxidoreductase
MLRRDILRSGLAVGAGVALLRPAWAATNAWAELPLITKAIPTTGEKLPAVGLGTDAFQLEMRAAIQAEIQRLKQLDGTVIDTAPSYGTAYGESEMLIGDTLAALGIRDHMFVATKLTATGKEGGQSSFERSLKLLKTQRIDLLQVHDVTDDQVDPILPLMQKWKQAGNVRYLGISTSDTEEHAKLLKHMHRYPLDFVQVNYSLADRDADKNVLPLAVERRMAVLINIPFGGGDVIRKALTRKLPNWAADIGVTSWAQFLLKYVISHPAVTCAIPGSTKVEHLEDNERAARGRLPDEAMRRKMEQFWDAS